MRLTELSPGLTDCDDLPGVKSLTFDCPEGCGAVVGIMIGPQQSQRVWSFTGEFPETISVQPSIRVYAHDRKPIACEGWHGYLTNGELTAC